MSESEWEKTKQMLKDTEDDLFHTQGSSYQMLINSRFAKALRLIMEEVEILELTQGGRIARHEAIAMIEKRRLQHV